MTFVTTDYISAGGNRNTSAADWDPLSGQLAFGADQNVALWRPQGKEERGISILLRGHSDKVTAVKFATLLSGNGHSLITGSANGELRVWRTEAGSSAWHCSASVKAHEGSLNAIAVCLQSQSFATAGADATVKIWKLEIEELSPLHVIPLKPRYIPLTVALGGFGDGAEPGSMFLCVAGTRNSIQIYSLTEQGGSLQHELQANLPGHKGWIRSLTLRCPNGGTEDDIILASASQDKYVRLWRFHCGDATFNQERIEQNGVAAMAQTLTSKVQTIKVTGLKYSITFEALLVGHEDWIYTAAWNPKADSLQLLTASADNSLTIWEPDPTSGIWVSAVRLGDISDQKGATTATGSAGGFWIGLWSPDGEAVTCLGRTGSWRLWENDEKLQYLVQKSGISGHVGPVIDLSWDMNGDYLLSTGVDQTTRMYAEWRRDSTSTWHEFSRPQIHGYNLNCVTSIGPNQFVSGAEEKLLRVFNKPKAVANMMTELCKIAAPDTSFMAEAANMPVLGLSNKAVETSDDSPADTNGDDDNNEPTNPTPTLNILPNSSPPSEDLLARHTLWPEHEKLYGHGYEISALACSPSNTTIATACKASSLDHAVIRLYSTTAATFPELKPPLTAHSLTVTRLQFSPHPHPHTYLLSVGRDRQWSLFHQAQQQHGPESQSSSTWTLHATNPKAHSRMILDCAWLPTTASSASHYIFATAGRDKAVRIWTRRPSSNDDDDDKGFVCQTTITRPSPVTAIAFTPPRRSSAKHAQRVGSCLAVGEETGQISLHVLDVATLKVVEVSEVEEAVCPSKAVTRLAWRPERKDVGDDSGGGGAGEAEGTQLAVAAADASLRVLRVIWEG